jgi:hypothetical protein
MSKKNSKLVLVKPQASLRKAERMNNVMKELQEEFDARGDISEMCDDIALIEYLCNLVENVTRVVLKGDEKRDLVVKLMTAKFPFMLNENEINRIIKACNHFCNTGRVQKVPTTAAVKKGVIGFLTKRLS